MSLQRVVAFTAALAAVVQAGVLNERQIKFTPTATATLVTPPTPHITKPANRFPNEAKDCNKWHTVEQGNVCWWIIDQHRDITEEQFYKWNPDVSAAKCSNLYPGDHVCIGVSSDDADEPGPTLPPMPHPDDEPEAPVERPSTMPGVTLACKKFHKVDSGDRCEDILPLYHISLDDFLDWNTRVSKDCHDMWAGYYVCVGV